MTGLWKTWEDLVPFPPCVNLGKSLNLPDNKINYQIALCFFFFPVNNLFLFRAKFIMHFLLYENGAGLFKHFFFLSEDTLLNFISRGRWRDVAEGTS